MKLALAQCTARVGDDPRINVTALAGLIAQAAELGADLVVFPELALCGYSPEDLLLAPDFYARSAEALAALAQQACCKVVIGHPTLWQGRRFNGVSLLDHGEVTPLWYKHHLPDDEVFDEPRYFASGAGDPWTAADQYPFGIIHLQGRTIGVGLCADFWFPSVARVLKERGAELLLSLNASPYHRGKVLQRQNIMRLRVEETGLPLVYVNLVGGQDEMVFDGGSFVLGTEGAVVAQMPQFLPNMAIVDWQGDTITGESVSLVAEEEEVYQALVLGLKDFVHANRFTSVVLGLSGGVDSALTLLLAVDALGAANVQAVMLPTQFTSAMSLEDAEQLSANAGVRYEIIPIETHYQSLVAALSPHLRQPMSLGDVTVENIQARLRAVILMALSNRHGSLLLSTGNKSEIAMGYATLYGDMAGGFAPLKDVWKTWVYRLARYRNSSGNRGTSIIPERILTRAPSAELRHNQTDQDTLPPYEILDAMMQAYVEEAVSREGLLARGYPAALVDQTLTRLHRAEFKRRQAAIGPRVTHRAFGKDWRYPISCNRTEEK